MVTAAPETEGFGILTEIDVHSTMQARLGSDGRHHQIRGACDPPLAHCALTAELVIVAQRLPCNVVVREEVDGRLVIGFVYPVAVLQMTSNPEVGHVAHEVIERLGRVRETLISRSATTRT